MNGADGTGVVNAPKYLQARRTVDGFVTCDAKVCKVATAVQPLVGVALENTAAAVLLLCGVLHAATLRFRRTLSIQRYLYM